MFQKKTEKQQKPKKLAFTSVNTQAQVVIKLGCFRSSADFQVCSV